MIAAAACFTLSAACMLALYCQAVLRGVTLKRHLGDAFSAAIRGHSPPRPALPRAPVDQAYVRRLERELLEPPDEAA